MGLESVSVVSDLVASNPLGTDNESQGDDHLRAIKSGLRTTFPNASRPFAFPNAIAEVAGNLTVNETTHRNTTVPFNASVAARTATLPSTPVDGWEFEVIKTDPEPNAVIVTGAQSINNATSVQVTSRGQAVRCLYDATAGVWRGRFSSPSQPYFPGGTGISLGDIGAKSTSQRVMAAAASGESWSGYSIGRVLEFLATTPGYIATRNDTAWVGLAPSSTSGAVLRSQGSTSPLIWGSPPLPASMYASTAAVFSYSGAIPLDSTTPQIGEGFPLFSVSIVPTKASSRVKVEVELHGSPALSNNYFITALFKNGAADAVGAAFEFNAGLSPFDLGGRIGMTSRITYDFAPGVTTAVSFQVRSGQNGAGNIVLNGGNTGTSYFGGGIVSSFISATEYFTS